MPTRSRARPIPTSAPTAAQATAPADGPAPAAGATAFDADYYHRFYGDPASRVSDRAAVARLAAFVAAYLRYLDVPVRRILDLGCGIGHWQAACRTLWPRASWLGVEWSEHLCARFGWTHGSVVDFTPPRRRGGDGDRFDLVICQGVLQYLDDAQATRAIDNLGRLCRGALYLEALTALDWRQNCDRSRTDGAVHLRPGAFYHERLARHFQAAGGGVFVHRRAGVTLFELEGTGDGGGDGLLR